MSEPQKPSPVHILLGIIVLCVIVQMLGLYDFTTLMGDKTSVPSPTGSGGAGSGGAGSGGAGSGGAGSGGAASTQELNTGNVKFIELKKTVTSLTGDSILNFAELKVYDNNNNLLLPARFQSAVHTPAGGWANDSYPAMNCVDGNDNNFCSSAQALETSMLFTLVQPSFVKKVTILNRLDSAYNQRIQGVRVNLFDRNMVLINTCTLLNNNRTQDCTW